MCGIMLVEHYLVCGNNKLIDMGLHPLWPVIHPRTNAPPRSTEKLLIDEITSRTLSEARLKTPSNVCSPAHRAKRSAPQLSMFRTFRTAIP